MVLIQTKVPQSLKLLVQFGQVSAAVLIANILFYLFQVLAGRGLGPAEYGLFGALFGMVYLASSVAAAIQTTVAKMVAAARADLVSDRVGRIVAASIVRVLILDAAICLVLLGATPWIAAYIHGPNLLVLITVGLIAVSLFPSIAQGTLQGEQRFGAFAFYVLFLAASRLSLGILALYLGWGVAGLLAMSALSNVMTAIPAFLSARPLFNAPRWIDEGAGFFKFAAPALIGSVAMALPGSVDVVIVRHFFNEGTAGLYAAAATLGKGLAVASSVTATMLFPKFVEHHSQNRKGTWLLLSKGLVVSGLLLSGGLLALTFLARPLLVLFLGSSYAAAAPLLSWYGVAMFFFGLSITLLTYHLATGRLAYFYSVLLPHVVAEVVLMYMFHDSMVQVVTVLVGVNMLLLLTSIAYTLTHTGVTGSKGGTRVVTLLTESEK